MKKRSLKLLSIILATVLLVTIFGGCAKKVDDTDKVTYDEAEEIFPAGPPVKWSVWHWYDQTTGVFNDSDFFSHYGFVAPDNVGFGTYGARHRDGDAYLCLMLDPRDSMFTIESVGNIRSIQGICEFSYDDNAPVVRSLDEKAPRALLVALNAVFDCMLAYKAGELDNLEEALEAIEVEGVSMNILTDDEAEESKTNLPEAANVVKIGSKEIALVNNIDDWRDSSGNISLEALFDDFGMSFYGNRELVGGDGYSMSFNLYINNADGPIECLGAQFRNNGDVVYRVKIQRFNDEVVEETAEGVQISGDLAWLLLYAIEEWNYRRDTLDDDMRTIADGNTLGQDLIVEVIPFPQMAP